MINEIEKIESNTVGIIGCGWLGKALAETLIKKKISVLATSSKQENVDVLNGQSIYAQQLTLPASVNDLAQHEVFTQQSLVIAITPQLRQGRTDYAEKITQLVNVAEKVGVTQRIILLSSTAVYDGLNGSVNEDSPLNFTTAKVKILNAAEKAVLNFSKQEIETDVKQQTKQGVVLRLAGLVGPDRHPGKFILAKKTLSSSTAPVNLIHQQDAIGLIELLLETPLTSAIFNGVSDTHVTKEQYYQTAAEALGLTLPKKIAVRQSNQVTKIVSGEKTKDMLGYQFVYPNLLTWL